MQEIIHSFMTFLYSLKVFIQNNAGTATKLNMVHSFMLDITVLKLRNY